MNKELERGILDLWRSRSNNLKKKQEGMSERIPRAKFMVLPAPPFEKGNTYISILVEGIVLESVIDYKPKQFGINGIIVRQRNRDKLLVTIEGYTNRLIRKKYNKKGRLIKETITYS